MIHCERAVNGWVEWQWGFHWSISARWVARWRGANSLSAAAAGRRQTDRSPGWMVWRGQRLFTSSVGERERESRKWDLQHQPVVIVMELSLQYVALREVISTVLHVGSAFGCWSKSLKRCVVKYVFTVVPWKPSENTFCQQITQVMFLSTITRCLYWLFPSCVTWCVTLRSTPLHFRPCYCTLYSTAFMWQTWFQGSLKGEQIYDFCYEMHC